MSDGDAVTSRPARKPVPDRVVCSPTLGQIVYQKIMREIMHGTYEPGQRLPTEEALCRRFAASRPVVREALARLRNEEIIYSRRGSGSYVLTRPERATGRPPPVASILDIKHCFEFRAAVEAESAFYAAARAGSDDLDRIGEALRRLDEAVPTGSPAIREDFDFHIAIAKASGNPFIESALVAMVEQIQFGMNLSGSLARERSEARLALIGEEHARVFDAVCGREPQAARAHMRAHIENTWRRIFGSKHDDIG